VPLVFLVTAIVVIFGLSKGYYLVAVFGLMGPSKRVGFPGFIIASVYLFYKGEWIIGALPLLLILWNVFGNRIFSLKDGE